MGKMINADEAANRLGIDVSRVRKLCKARRIKGARLLGKVWLIPDPFEVTPGKRGPKIGGR